MLGHYTLFSIFIAIVRVEPELRYLSSLDGVLEPIQVHWKKEGAKL